jgi:hypothetical protein
MRRSLLWAFAAAASLPVLQAGSEKLTDEQRIELIRGLSAEYATVKVTLPRSKKALDVETEGKYDKAVWDQAARQYGPAARAGDLVQVTKLDIEGDRIVFQINGGFNSGKGKWYRHVQIGMGGGANTQTTPVSPGGQATAVAGTSIALVFHKPVPALKAAEVKKMLAPVLDFEKQTVTQTRVESLPPEFQQAVKEKRAVAGMDRDQVLLALGRPVRKVRETKDGEETEDWIYGTPPGKIVFVTFMEGKVTKVKETYAGLGTEAPPLQTPR